MVETRRALWALWAIGLAGVTSALGERPATHDLSEYLVRVEEGVALHRGGEKKVLEKEFKLADGAVVGTNGVVTLPGGVEQELPPERRLTLDGFITGPDGRLFYLRDHAMRYQHELVRVLGGVMHPAGDKIVLANGVTLLDEGQGKVVRPNGDWYRLQDGQSFALSGEPLKPWDHAWNEGGKVTVQKGATLIPLDNTRAMVMEDGTRVRGTGEIIFRDGTRARLEEGKRMNFPGPVFSR